MLPPLTRRHWMAGAWPAGAWLAGTWLAGAWPTTAWGQSGPAVRALANEGQAERALRAFTQGAVPSPQGIRLELPELVENGATVPVVVQVDSPMTAEHFVRRIALFNERNPSPDMVVFTLSPACGLARVSTRVRLATSQQVHAVAELSDGSFRATAMAAIVTLAACIEETVEPSGS